MRIVTDNDRIVNQTRVVETCGDECIVRNIHTLQLAIQLGTNAC